MVEQQCACYEQALRLAPDIPGLRSRLTYLRQSLCSWDGIEEHWAAVRAAVTDQQDGSVIPCFFAHVPATPAEQLACARNWTASHYAPAEAPGRVLFPRRRSAPRTRLHIG